ncbi:TIGR04438 family Trp-rich protein [Macromonas bipunctata]|uniref:TIGR04438 family Trp-rich protein n=1 Tax=Macromonas bipunctata TaxID=183670 RepID=UPI000C32E525|nr:TIGR04438 family Trp-rich protein [Macromonas bipunctata]
MYLLLLGLLFIVAKYLGWSPVASWPWWWVLSPLGLAVLWWWLADVSGYTRRQADKQMAQRQRDRLNKGRERMGLPPLKD